MRLSFVGSTGWFGSTYSSRLPLPLVSRTSAVQPCDFAASPVSSNILVLSQPTTPVPPPLDVHSVSLASLAKFRWWVVKQVSTKVYFIVFGSSIASWRLLSGTGNALADGWSDPFWQNAGFLGPRTDAAIHIRPLASIMELWLLTLVSQICSSPQ